MGHLVHLENAFSSNTHHISYSVRSVRHNQFAEVPYEAVAPLGATLETLDLGGNLIRAVDGDARLAGLAKLKRL